MLGHLWFFIVPFILIRIVKISRSEGMLCLPQRASDNQSKWGGQSKSTNSPPRLHTLNSPHSLHSQTLISQFQFSLPINQKFHYFFRVYTLSSLFFTFLGCIA